MQPAKYNMGQKPLIDLLDLIGTCGDVIYVGAHNCQSLPKILAMSNGSVTLFEPQTKPYERIRPYLPPNIRLIKKAVSDYIGTADFYLASNEESSSLLAMASHTKYYPDITFTGSERVEVTTLDHEQLPCDLLVMDIQGNEMAALRGAVQTIAKARFMILEYGLEPLYEGQTILEDMSRWLAEHGFIQAALQSPHHPTWGNVLYLRNDPAIINVARNRLESLSSKTV